MCHYELARDRPSPQYLTEFFLLMSVGGMLGGVFNSLVAPLVFLHAYEYPLALIIACLMVPQLSENRRKDEEAEAPQSEQELVSPTPSGSGRSHLALDYHHPGAARRRVLLPAEVAGGIGAVREDSSQPARAAQNLSSRNHRGDPDLRGPGDGLLLLRRPAAAVRPVRRGHPRADDSIGRQSHGRRSTPNGASSAS